MPDLEFGHGEVMADAKHHESTSHQEKGFNQFHFHLKHF